MQNARAAYQRCKAFDETDDQVAFRVTFEASAFSGTGDFVAARVGGLIMVTAGLSVSSTSAAAQLESDDFASFTKTAYARIT